MKKKIWLPILIVFILAVFFVPVPTGIHKDGGTREYTALTYKIVDWNRNSSNLSYDKTRVYIFPNNFKSIDKLLELESENVNYKFTATVLEITGNSVLVDVQNDEYLSGDQISFGRQDLEDIDVRVGDLVEITYDGVIMESYPAQIFAKSWRLSDALRYTEYTDEWLDKEVAEKPKYEPFEHIVITKIYSNCFFARTVTPTPYVIKLNGTLSDDWCVGDQVTCKYKNTYYDSENQRMECDFTSVSASDWKPEPGMSYKPVIYLYPQKETEVSVELDLRGKLTCTYPKYNNAWKVTAFPDGTLINSEGQTYNYLYWEGETDAQYDLTKGFCVKGEDTAGFLEDALAKLGLTRKEANEFIVYWLPLMEQNPYNIISFQTEAYTDAAKLKINPSTDTLIRVFMAYQPTENYVELPKQQLSAPQRNGFTAVEWGGTQIK